MPKTPRASSPVGRVEVGDKVRVKHGVLDSAYPDMPMGGWAGSIAEEADPRFTTADNRKLMQEHLLGPRGLKRKSRR